MPKRRIYLDYAATSPLDPRVVEAMLPYLTDVYGNPSSLHATGRRARRALEDAREQIAHTLACQPTEILFTSGGTESDNCAVLGIARAQRAAGRGNHVITSQIEHHAVLHACAQLEAEGFRVTYLPVDAYGLVDPHAVEVALSDNTVLVSIMAVNNEIGTAEPVPEIASICRGRDVPLHTDAIQAMGNLEVSVAAWGVDALSLTAHKCYGPKGVGLLVLRQGLPFQPLMAGGGQEREQRPGTENVAAIVGMAAALRIAHEERAARVAHAQALRERLEEGIETRLPGRSKTDTLPGGSRTFPTFPSPASRTRFSSCAWIWPAWTSRTARRVPPARSNPHTCCAHSASRMKWRPAHSASAWAKTLPLQTSLLRLRSWRVPSLPYARKQPSRSKAAACLERTSAMRGNS